MRRSVAAIATVTLALMVGPGLAEEKMKMDHSHGHAHHGQTKAVEVKPGTEAEGVGILNSVDPEKNMVNLTHEPMPELGWPVMTMDLPVTKRVDLGSVKAGERIDFKLKLGRDKKYRVIEMSSAK